MNPDRWTDSAVRSALGIADPPSGAMGIEFAGICTDTRTLRAGDLYVALRGDRFDGHAFVAQAFAGGAAGAVVSELPEGVDLPVVYVVPDTLKALGDLALHRRESLDAKVVGITGSSGKTTTKNFTAAAISGSFRVHETPGNYNNRVGLPKTVLDAPSDTEVLVLEMGTNEPGEIAELTRIGRPDVGVVTTVSEAHLEKLGSVEGVLTEKLDLLRGLPNGGTAFVGDTPETLPRAARGLNPNTRVVGWTELADPDLRPERSAMDETGCYSFEWNGTEVQLRVPGRHAVTDALIALAVAESLSVSPQDAAKGLETVQSGSLRGELRSVGGITLILDCYNANPESMRAALSLLRELSFSSRGFAVLGSMLELGESSAELHQSVLAEALSSSALHIFATGEFATAASAIGPSTHLSAVVDPSDVVPLLLNELETGDVVLFKASRGVALESVAQTVIDALDGES